MTPIINQMLVLKQLFMQNFVVDDCCVCVHALRIHSIQCVLSMHGLNNDLRFVRFV